MSILKAKAQQTSSVARVSEGDDVYLRTMRDGALFTADWKNAAIMEGRGFMVNVGAFSTPIAGGGSANVVDQDRPSLIVSVPNGTSILPLRIEVALLDVPGAADDDEVDILIAVDQDAAWDATGACTTEVIYNMNTLHSRASSCASRSAFSTTMTTDPVLDLELAHFQKIFESHSATGVVWTDSRMLYEPKAPPIINGPAMLLVYYGGTNKPSGFVCAQWLEFPESYFA